MVEEGAVDDVDEIFGLHIWSPMRAGELGVDSGAVMANSDTWEIRVIGKGGHGGSPDTSVDPIVAGATLVTSLQSIVGRNVSPYENGVISVCQFTAGTTCNVIPDCAILRGTVRSYKEEVKVLMKKRIREICVGLESMFGVKIG